MVEDERRAAVVRHEHPTPGRCAGRRRVGRGHLDATRTRALTDGTVDEFVRDDPGRVSAS